MTIADKYKYDGIIMVNEGKVWVSRYGVWSCVKI